MPTSINKAFLIGTIGRTGVEVRYTASGSAVASFLLALAELWSDGKEHVPLIPCEVLGKRAEAVAELEPGTPVCVDGKVLRRKLNEKWETVIGCWDLPTITVPVTPVEAV
jgi:single-stranded DNA-binding protein